MSKTRLKRDLGLWDAVLLGLGSIVGTGVFVSIGIAAGIVGPAAILAIMVGGLVASFNGLSSAQLAANHPVSGGTYEYGYAYLSPVAGFSAGWLFLLAKSASAATAALGLSAYVLGLVGAEGPARLLAAVTVLSITAIAYTGVRRSSLVNTLIVSVTLASLVVFALLGLPTALLEPQINLRPFFRAEGSSVRAFLYASALMFVSYTGYGRIATLGEEVKSPRRTIPRAIITTLVVSAALYALVGFVAIGSVGHLTLLEAGSAGRLLEVAAANIAAPWLPVIILVGAVTALLSVLLNLILGLSRVLLAMARRGDMPRGLAVLNKEGSSPTRAVLAVGIFIAALTLLGDVKTTWSFSAFTVLSYYALTNLAALRLTLEERFFPAWVSVAGLLSCLGLAFFVDWPVLLVGIGLILIGLVWFFVNRYVKW